MFARSAPGSCSRLVSRKMSMAADTGPQTPVVEVERFSRAVEDKDDGGMRLVSHPSGAEVSFDTGSHRYVWVPTKTGLRSVSSLLRAPLRNEDGGRLPPVTHPFDMDGIAERVSAAQGRTVEEVKQEWRDIAEFGTKFHDYINKTLTGTSLPGAVEWSPEELEGDKESAYQQAFESYWATLNTYGYELHPSGSEKIVASERWGLAGTIDCLLHCPQGNAIYDHPHYLMVDWKTNKSPLRGATVFPGSPKTLNWPFEHLTAVKLSEYKLQLSSYKYLLKSEGYLEHNHPVYTVIAQFLQKPDGSVKVDGIRLADQPENKIEALFAAAKSA